MSSVSTPGERPAPDTDWSDVMITWRIPKASWSGFSVMASPMVVQLGTGVMKPVQPRRRFCTAMSRSWSRFTPGMKTGTSSS
jgi:hypothetical protein